jgi:DNA invertase Pin-like site-specific DNA recombinase
MTDGLKLALHQLSPSSLVLSSTSIYHIMEKITAGYIRVSTREQAIESLSLERQQEKVLNAGAQTIFEDQQSASKSQDTRPELGKLLDLVRQGKVHRVITPRMDRMVRSSRNLHKILEVFEDAGADIEFLDIPLPSDNPIFGKMVLNFFGMIAEIETDNLSQRIKSEQRQRRERKLANHSKPFGYVVVDGKYRLDHRRYSFSPPESTNQGETPTEQEETFRTQHKTMAEPDVSADQQVYTIHDLAREAIILFLEVRNPRATLHRLFKRFGTTRVQGRRNSSNPVLSWTPEGFVGWLSNPVLRGDTVYLERITNAKGKQEINPDGPIYERDTHPDERLLSDEEWEAIGSILALNRRIGSKGFQSDLDSSQVYTEFAFLNGLVHCIECGAKCTPKTSAQGKYQYFACRYAGVSCNNKGSVQKAEIEKFLIQDLVKTSKQMQEQAMQNRRTMNSSIMIALQLSGADESEILAFQKTTSPQYRHLNREQSWGFMSSSRLEQLTAQRAGLDTLLGTHHSIEEAKKIIDQEIREEEARVNAFMDRDAAEIIFNGNNLAFWQGLTNDEKVIIYNKVVNKIFTQGRLVKQVYLNSEPRQASAAIERSEALRVEPKAHSHSDA